MKRIIISIVIAGLVFLANNGVAGTAEQKGSEIKKEGSPPPVKFNPPMLGKPGKRIGGGTRGYSVTDIKLVAFVPDRIGITSSSEPSLCWYLSQPTNIRMEITLDDGKSIKPIYQQTINKPGKTGIQCMSLAGTGTKLQPSIEYQWFVAIIPDAGQRSKDILSGGSIMLKVPSDELTKKFAAAKGIELVSAYAENGYWYEAIGRAVVLLEQNPSDEVMTRTVSGLLKQAGLPVF
ncbi:MAG: DUF928 domain-containing protein [Syntrophorhabdus sp.]